VQEPGLFSQVIGGFKSQGVYIAAEPGSEPGLTDLE
jgi:hypothetical protein